jgi:prepilin-type N-terminal cleavage/methylation domain-containing protein/prepilin-type processing-associated H-X9-DG protein
MFPQILPAKARRAFTLIELLVVIAIIAILASILFPVFGRARENARRSSCQSNLKQIGLGIMQYTQDYDEKFPRAWSSTTNGGFPGDYKWMDATQPYLKSTQIFQCPSASGDQYTYIQKTANRWGSYGINSIYWGGGVPADKVGIANSGMSIANVAATATTVLCFDSNSDFQLAWDLKGNNPTTLVQYNGVNCLAKSNDCTNFNDPGGVMERHLDTSTILYCDGHVKSVKLASMLALSSDGYLKAFTPADD